MLKEPTSSSLAILESAVTGAAMPGPSGVPRAFRTPPPGVCNSMLVQAAKDPELAEKAAEIAEALMKQGTPLEAATLRVRTPGHVGLHTGEGGSRGELRSPLVSGQAAGLGGLAAWRGWTRHGPLPRIAAPDPAMPCCLPPPDLPRQALISSLAKADALPDALPVLDAWLQQQEGALEQDAGTHAPLQVRRGDRPHA